MSATSEDAMSAGTTALSDLLGWGYFFAWSFSFWPQVIANYRAKSCRGLSLEFQWLNALGFTCYAIYNVAVYSFARVRDDDAARNHGTPTDLVKPNDVAFAVHALFATLLTLRQIYMYDEGRVVALWCKLAVASTMLVLFFALVETVSRDVRWEADQGFWSSHNAFTWLGWVTLVSFVKLGVSCVKYIPCVFAFIFLSCPVGGWRGGARLTTKRRQVWLNYKRRSTKGWSILNVLLDLLGGVLSLMQLVLDASSTGDWTAATDNPIKFGLGFVSIFFDGVFLMQHYYWFPATAAATSSTAPTAHERADEERIGLL